MSACGESHPEGAATCLHADNASQQFCNQVDERIPRTRRGRTTAADAARPTTLHPFLPRSMPIAAIFLIYAIRVTETFVWLQPKAQFAKTESNENAYCGFRDCRCIATPDERHLPVVMMDGASEARPSRSSGEATGAQDRCPCAGAILVCSGTPRVRSAAAAIGFAKSSPRGAQAVSAV